MLNKTEDEINQMAADLFNSLYEEFGRQTISVIMNMHSRLAEKILSYQSNA